MFGVNERNKNALRFFMHLVGSDLNNRESLTLARMQGNKVS